MARDDVDKVNGCMEVVPGSHKWGILGENDFRGRDLEAQIARIEARCVSFHNGPR